MVKGEVGLEPGDVVAVDRNGAKEVARDWPHVAELVNDDLPPSAEQLEGTQRGYVALMEWANRQLDAAESQAKQAAEQLPQLTAQTSSDPLDALPADIRAELEAADQFSKDVETMNSAASMLVQCAMRHPE